MRFVSCLIAGCLLGLLATAAPGQATKPAAVPAISKAFEQESLEGAPPTNADAKPETDLKSLAPTGSGDLTRVGLALVIVVGVILLLRTVGKKFFLIPTGPKSNAAIKVLSRSVVSPKQQLMLLQVGKRLVVVGDSGGQMNALCQITEPDEVAELIGSVKSEAKIDPAKSFRSLFGRAKAPFEGEPNLDKSDMDSIAKSELLAPRDPELPPESMINSTREEIVDLMDTVKRMRNQFKSS